MGEVMYLELLMGGGYGWRGGSQAAMEGGRASSASLALPASASPPVPEGSPVPAASLRLPPSSRQCQPPVPEGSPPARGSGTGGQLSTRTVFDQFDDELGGSDRAQVPREVNFRPPLGAESLSHGGVTQ